MRGFGTLLSFGAAIVLWLFYITMLRVWLGLLGLILGIVIAPGLFLFPFLFWIIEGVFPITYFILLGLSILGGIIRAFARE